MSGLQKLRTITYVYPNIPVMKLLTFCLALSLAFATTAHAQGTTAAANTQSVIKAYAKGDDSYLIYSETYNPAKKYVVFKFWNESSPLSAAEKAEMDYLKDQLAKKNVDVVFFPWKTTQDLQQNLSKYNFSVEALSEKRISIKDENCNLHTTSGKALFVVEDGKPVSLCSGQNCGEMVKTFFTLKSLN